MCTSGRGGWKAGRWVVVGGTSSCMCLIRIGSQRH